MLNSKEVAQWLNIDKGRKKKLMNKCKNRCFTEKETTLNRQFITVYVMLTIEVYGNWCSAIREMMQIFAAGMHTRILLHLFWYAWMSSYEPKQYIRKRESSTHTKHFPSFSVDIDSSVCNSNVSSTKFREHDIPISGNDKWPTRTCCVMVYTENET